MSRKAWLWSVVVLIAVALAATFFFAAKNPDAPAGPAPTPFGWTAQLRLVAGDGVRGMRNGPAAQVRFDDPYGVAVTEDGTLYVADAGDNNRIRRIGSDGVVTTLAGFAEGFADGDGTAARFNTPSGLALDRAGNLYVADTGNHAIRKVTPLGRVSTVAGTGLAGFRDGAGTQAQFNGPIGVAVDAHGDVYVADTYNDRIRRIDLQGRVSTLAGGDRPGNLDGVGAAARFDTPTALAVDAQGIVWVADTRNNAIRRVAPDGTVVTPYYAGRNALYRPMSLALTHDGLLYVGEMSSGRVIQLSRDGRPHVLTGATQAQRLSRPAGLVLDAKGTLLVADAGSRRLHRIAAVEAATAMATPTLGAVGPAPDDPLPATDGRWPLHPQDGWHEVVGTLGEVRGNYDNESRDHLHGGLDIRGDVGAQVLAIADGKVSSPSGAWGLEELGEGMAIDGLSYIHMRVGRDARGVVSDPRFQLLRDEAGEPERMRVPRGTRFKAGEVLGTINRMAHVHLSVGANGFERNAVALGFSGYADHYSPRIESIELFDASERSLAKRADGRVRVPRGMGVQIVVDAWDQVDRNLPRRRLGLHALGYQVLRADGTPWPGYETPRMNIEFNRMPADPDAVKVAYAPGSGITVHGSAATHFKYVVSNIVRDGELAAGAWWPDDLPAGDYTLRITAVDYMGNAASAGRDLNMVLE
ncbi:NHL repeat-containing protein [Pseudoxanthomonas sacheonensis]|uniref:Sugar lactone lactonase YvrE n=1 Tax=Pseudoxanthomonas sacheonensis TaxID=443615 RepID=A0ABU1RRX4_9GAMM|nr:NHL repeat-containing protein [Pseudoxanthomonas sacheonensis]MDR6841514.1 sugar lactone lactonase YvrE [Pseudoxanthomonas sacheonensis]